MNIKVWRECSPRKTDKELLGGAGTCFISNNLGTLLEQTEMLGKQSPVSMLLSGLRCLGSRDPCAGAGERVRVECLLQSENNGGQKSGSEGFSGGEASREHGQDGLVRERAGGKVGGRVNPPTPDT